MISQTDIFSVKEIALKFVDIEPERDDMYGSILAHPYINSNTVVIKGQSYFVDDVFDDYKSMICDKIKELDNPCDFLELITNKYKARFICETEPYISPSDLGAMLSNWWVNDDDPNSASEVKDGSVTNLFKEVYNKSSMMDVGEIEIYNSLPDSVSLYKCVENVYNYKGNISWHLSKEKAMTELKMLNTSGKSGAIVMLTIPKVEILAYFNSNDEDEVIYDMRR